MDLLAQNGQGDIPRIKVTVEFDYESQAMAESVLKSIEVDNYHFVKCERDDKKIICHVEGEKIASVLHTLDDLIACVCLAEEVYRKA